MSQLNELSITLKSPVTTGGPIAQAKISVERDLPADAIFKAELTNNANDPVPAWEDATAAIVGGYNYVFANDQATKGYAFNLRITVKRGPSGRGGYVGKIRGAIGADVAMKLLNSIRSGLGIDDMRDQITYNTDAIADVKSRFDPQTATAPTVKIQAALGGIPLGVTARLVATQAGSGDPSPDNVRAIAGRDAVNVARTGKNQFDKTNKRGGWDSNGVSSQIESGIKITTVAGTSSSSTWHLPLIWLGKTVTIQARSRVMSGTATGQRIWIHFGTGTNANAVTLLEVVMTDGYGQGSITIPDALPDGSEWLAVRLYANRSVDARSESIVEFTNIQLELGPAAMPYEPYAGQSYAIPLPETLYGLPGAEDEIDLTRGIITRRTKLLTLTGGEDWGEYRTNDWTATYVRFFARGSVSGTDALLSGLSTHLKRGSATSAGYWPNTFLTHTNGYLYTAVEIAGVTDLDTWVAYLAAQHAAGTPVQVLYELAEPETLTIPPVLIPSLLGENNIFTDGGGDTTVGWRMDMQPAIEALQAQITALQALLTQP